MWWPGKKQNTTEAASQESLPVVTPVEQPQISSPSGPTLLEDLPPKFQDNVAEAERKRRSTQDLTGLNTISGMLGSLSFSDFLGMHKIPCFREGMLGGFIAGGCVFGAMVTFRRPLSSAMNWAVGAWTVGSVGRWEQCRYERAKSFRNAQTAKEAFVRSHLSEQDAAAAAAEKR